jgi:hypothetical protein
MSRYVKVATAQMGPNQDGTPREAIAHEGIDEKEPNR